jgi:hypothetical protein
MESTLCSLVCIRNNKHVAWVNAGTVNPRVVEVRLSSLNKHDLEIMVQVGQTASNNTTVHHQ